MNTTLPERLRLGTREQHRQAERSGLMARMLAGRIDAASYAALLCNLHALYTALEDALRAAAADPCVQRLPMAGLWRAPALAADLQALSPPLRQALQPSTPALDYAAHLQALPAAAPQHLVAHAYLRYLGDLHGGQVLQRQVLQALGPGAPVGFYDFGPPAQVAALRQAFRDALAAMPVAGAEVDAMVDEARWGFMQHQRIFEALG